MFGFPSTGMGYHAKRHHPASQPYPHATASGSDSGWGSSLPRGELGEIQHQAQQDQFMAVDDSPLYDEPGLMIDRNAWLESLTTNNIPRALAHLDPSIPMTEIQDELQIWAIQQPNLQPSHLPEPHPLPLFRYSELAGWAGEIPKSSKGKHKANENKNTLATSTGPVPESTHFFNPAAAFNQFQSEQPVQSSIRPYRRRTDEQGEDSNLQTRTFGRLPHRPKKAVTYPMPGGSKDSRNIFAEQSEQYEKENPDYPSGKVKLKARSLSLPQALAHPYLRPDEQELLIPRHNFTPGFKQLTQAMLAQSTYGKNLERLLNDDSGFRVHNQNGGILLEHYSEPPQKKAPFQGICNELAYSVGKQVRHILGNSFEVKVATGTCEDYFPNGTHYYLLVWPKTKSEQMEKELQKSTRIPKGCFLIDPSFKQMVPPHVMENKKRYKVNSIHGLEEFHPANMKPYQYASEELPVTLPIGFVDKVAPEVADQYGPKTLIYLRFEQNFQPGAAPLVSTVLQQDPKSSLNNPDYEFIDQLSPQNKFAQLYTKIVRSLHPVSHASAYRPADPWQEQLFPHGAQPNFNTWQPAFTAQADHQTWLDALLGPNGEYFSQLFQSA